MSPRSILLATTFYVVIGSFAAIGPASGLASADLTAPIASAPAPVINEI